MKTHQASSVTAIALSMLMTACGGGGGDQTPAPPPPVTTPAHGAYQGTTSNGLSHNTIVLDNDQFYTLYGVTFSGTLQVLGFLHGQGKSNNGSYSSTDARDYYYTGAVIPGSLNASYTPNVSFNGSLTSASATITFTGAAIDSALYNYNTPANLANIAGAWNLTSSHLDPVNLSISPSGQITGLSVGCSFTGNAQAQASGKNVFDVTVTFGAAPCVAPGQTVSGIAIEHVLANGKRQLIVAGSSADRSLGAAFFGTR